MSVEKLFLPRSSDEALSLLQEHGPDLLVMGGGTVVMGIINEGAIFPQKVMSLHYTGLSGVQRINGHIAIGATTTIAQVSQLNNFPILAQAASMIGGPAIRNMATIGGNLLLPAPSGDTTVPLLAYDADVEVGGASGYRTVSLEQFLAEEDMGELVISIQVPTTPIGKTSYLRFGRRQANTPTVISVAARVVTDAAGTVSEARIALGAAAPHAIRARDAEAVLVGQRLTDASIADAAHAAMNECDPFTDALASAWYRRKMVGVYVRRALEAVAK